MLLCSQSSYRERVVLHIQKIKMRVRFPCKMHLEYQGQPVTKQLSPDLNADFYFNELVSLSCHPQLPAIELTINAIAVAAKKYHFGSIFIDLLAAKKYKYEPLNLPIRDSIDPSATCCLSLRRVFRETLPTSLPVLGSEQDIDVKRRVLSSRSCNSHKVLHMEATKQLLITHPTDDGVCSEFFRTGQQKYEKRIPFCESIDIQQSIKKTAQWSPDDKNNSRSNLFAIGTRESQDEEEVLLDMDQSSETEDGRDIKVTLGSSILKQSMLPLVRQNEEYQAEIKALKKDIDALENRLDRAMRRPISLEQTDEEIKQQVKELLDSLKSQRNEIKSQKTTIRQLKNCLREKDLQIMNLIQENKYSGIKLSNVEQKLKSVFGNQKYLEETNIQLSQAIDSLNFRLSRQSQNEDPERSDDNDTKLQECIKISSLLCRNSREKSQALQNITKQKMLNEKALEQVIEEKEEQVNTEKAKLAAQKQISADLKAINSKLEKDILGYRQSQMADEKTLLKLRKQLKQANDTIRRIMNKMALEEEKSFIMLCELQVLREQLKETNVSRGELVEQLRVCSQEELVGFVDDESKVGQISTQEYKRKVFELQFQVKHLKEFVNTFLESQEMACVNKIASEPLLRADDNMSITFSRAHNNLEQSVIIDRDKEELKEGTEEPDQTVPVEQNLVDQIIGIALSEFNNLLLANDTNLLVKPEAKEYLNQGIGTDTSHNELPEKKELLSNPQQFVYENRTHSAKSSSKQYGLPYFGEMSCDQLLQMGQKSLEELPSFNSVEDNYMPRRWQYSQNELLCTGMSTKENQEITSSSLKVLPDLSSMAQLAQIPEESLNEDEVSQLMREVCEVQKKLVLFGQENQTLQVQNKKLNRAASLLQEQIAVYKRESFRIKSQSIYEKNCKQQLLEQLKTYQKHYQKIEEEKMQLEAMLIGEQQRYEEVKEMLRKKETQLLDVQEQLNKLTQQESVMNENGKILRIENNDLKQKIEEAERRYQWLKQQTQFQIKELQEEVEVKTRQIQSLSENVLSEKEKCQSQLGFVDRSQHRLVECQEQLADLENLLEKAEERERVLVEEVKTKEEEFARTIYDYEYIIKELEKDQAVRLEEVNKKYEIKLAEANGQTERALIIISNYESKLNKREAQIRIMNSLLVNASTGKKRHRSSAFHTFGVDKNSLFITPREGGEKARSTFSRQNESAQYMQDWQVEERQANEIMDGNSAYRQLPNRKQRYCSLTQGLAVQFLSTPFNYVREKLISH